MQANSSDLEDENGTVAVRTFDLLFQNKPLILSKSVTSFVGFALGDLLAQAFIQGNGFFDWARFFRMGTFGFFIHGPLSHTFYGGLDGKLPGRGAWVVFTKVVIDQLCWKTILGISLFLYSGLLEFQGFSYVLQRLGACFLPQVLGSWAVWPAAHAVNFWFIPSSVRVLYINTIQIMYTCFLSVLANMPIALRGCS